MGVNIVVGLGLLTLLGAVALTLMGIGVLIRQWLGRRE